MIESKSSKFFLNNLFLQRNTLNHSMHKRKKGPTEGDLHTTNHIKPEPTLKNASQNNSSSKPKMTHTSKNSNNPSVNQPTFTKKPPTINNTYNIPKLIIAGGGFVIIGVVWIAAYYYLKNISSSVPHDTTTKTSASSTTSIAVPGQVQNVTSSAITSTQISLSWDKVDTASSYSVYNKELNSTIDSITTNQVVIQNLQPATNYHFTVTAVNQYGSGVSSAELLVETSTINVTNVSSLDITDTTLKLTWNSVQGAVSYTIQQINTVNNTDTIQIIASNVSDTNYTIVNMVPATLYKLQVVPINSLGIAGPPSDTLNVTKIGYFYNSTVFTNTEGYHVIIVAGQSNSQGWGIAKDSSGAYVSISAPLTPDGSVFVNPLDRPDPRIYHMGVYISNNPILLDYTYYNSAEWALAGNSSGAAAYNVIGFHLTYAKQVLATLPSNRKILVVRTGVGGTGFSTADSWLAQNNPSVAAGKTNLYQQSIDMSNLGMSKSVGSAGLEANNVLHSILWSQGESDTSFGAATGENPTALTTSQYTSDMIDLVNGFRTSITGANSKTPFINCGMCPAWRNTSGVTDPTKFDAIETAIEGIHSVINYSGTASSAGLTGQTDNVMGTVHFNVNDHHTLGANYWSVYQAIVQNS